jgi:hypothetical protein
MPDPMRNLVLVHDPGYQSLDDIERLKAGVLRSGSGIDVHIAHNTLDNSRLNRRIVARPTLVVSFTQLKRYRPSRGTVCQGRWISKFDQIEALQAIGVSAPRTALIGPGFEADPSEWGDVVLVKPALPGSTFGKFIHLVRTERLRYRAPDTYPANHPARHAPMLAQEFVRTGAIPSMYRVTTLLGEPLYCRQAYRKEGEVRTDVADEELEGMPVSIAAGPPIHTVAADDADVLETAVRAAQAFPDVPLQGMDLVRDEQSGRLFVLELNPGGNTWHLSSTLGRGIMFNIGKGLGFSDEEAAKKGRAEVIGQFGAFERAAESLVKATRARAS